MYPRTDHLKHFSIATYNFKWNFDKVDTGKLIIVPTNWKSLKFKAYKLDVDKIRTAHFKRLNKTVVIDVAKRCF